MKFYSQSVYINKSRHINSSTLCLHFLKIITCVIRGTVESLLSGNIVVCTMMQNIFIFLVAATASDADTTFTLIKKDAECKSSVNEEQYPMSASVETCADHCQKDPACTHFIYWNGENSFMAQLKRWQCWRETPKIGDDCGEDGFESDYFNFYRLDRAAGTTTMRTTVEGIGMTTATPLTTKPKTIEETQEWRDCLPRPFDLFFPTCTTLDLSSRGLIGSIPVDIKYMLNLETL